MIAKSDEGRPPLTRVDLDTAGCQAPGCTHVNHPVMYLHPRCHVSAGTRVEYHRDGVLRIRCRKCDSLVANVAVATFPLS
jgi:hypothetical protein